MLENEDVEIIKQFVGSGGMYLDVVYSGQFEIIGVTKERLQSLRERGYLTHITHDTYGLALAGVMEAQKMMRPWRPKQKVCEVSLDEFLEKMDDMAKVAVLNAVTEFCKRGLKPDYIKVGVEHYALRFKVSP